jgi:hypothetical protein
MAKSSDAVYVYPSYGTKHLQATQHPGGVNLFLPEVFPVYTQELHQKRMMP